jgi:mono/diheme cytochrome c family protein
VDEKIVVIQEKTQELFMGDGMKKWSVSCHPIDFREGQAVAPLWRVVALFLMWSFTMSACQGNFEQGQGVSIIEEPMDGLSPPSPSVPRTEPDSSNESENLPPSSPWVKPSGEEVARGASLYRQYCVRCHGVTGEGNGELAADLNPRPANLAAGVYKFRSTPSGSLPTDSDLFRILSVGVPGTAMSDFQELSEEARQSLVRYLKTLSLRFINEDPPTSIEFPEERGATDQGLEHGRQIFSAMQCAACHGKGGHGDGPLAEALQDSRGEPIRPANLTKYSLKSGKGPAAVYRTVMTGLDGTPMPSYGDSLSLDEGWDLALYVFSLGQKKGEQ